VDVPVSRASTWQRPWTEKSIKFVVTNNSTVCHVTGGYAARLCSHSCAVLGSLSFDFYGQVPAAIYSCV